MKTPDFYVDGIYIEVKSFEKEENAIDSNAISGKIHEASEQTPDLVIINAMEYPPIHSSVVNEAFKKAAREHKRLRYGVEVWTSQGEVFSAKKGAYNGWVDLHVRKFNK